MSRDERNSMEFESPARRQTDLQIESLRRELVQIRSELREKASHSDVQRVEGTILEKSRELKEAIDKRVTIDRYRLIELPVLTSIIAICGAALALVWKIVTRTIE